MTKIKGALADRIRIRNSQKQKEERIEKNKAGGLNDSKGVVEARRKKGAVEGRRDEKKEQLREKTESKTLKKRESLQRFDSYSQCIASCQMGMVASS